MARSIACLLAMTLASISLAGDIHVSCAPLHRIYLDDVLVGTTTVAERGLVLVDLPEGVHTIRVEKDGYVARSFEVRIPFVIDVGELDAAPEPEPDSEPERGRVDPVEPAEPVSWTVVESSEAERMAETASRAKGSLRVITRPSRCSIRFMGKQHEKTGMKLNLSYIPAGDHPIHVSCRGREMSAVVTIEDRTRTIVEVSFMKGDEPIVISTRPE